MRIAIKCSLLDMNLLQLWLPSYDLLKFKQVNILTRLEKGLVRPPPLAKDLLANDICGVMESFSLECGCWKVVQALVDGPIPICVLAI